MQDLSDVWLHLICKATIFFASCSDWSQKEHAHIQAGFYICVARKKSIASTVRPQLNGNVEDFRCTATETFHTAQNRSFSVEF
jgi:hypothetical protein